MSTSLYDQAYLPEGWLAALPEITKLPGRYENSEYGADAFLTWKRQEFLARTGRITEANIDLVAEALEDASVHDGPSWLDKALIEALFLLAWPKSGYQLGVELSVAADMLAGCLESSPSMEKFLDIEGAWKRARYRVFMLDEERGNPPEECPWKSVDEIMRTAKAKSRATKTMNERQLPTGEGLPPPSQPSFPGMEPDLPADSTRISDDEH